MSRRQRFTPAELSLGIDRRITRRDFLGGTLLGTGVALLGQPPPLSSREPGHDEGAHHWWNGYGGVGDYSRSNGNTWQVVNEAHAVRDRKLDSPGEVVDTGETYDLVIVGAGIAGLASAYYFCKSKSTRERCLILDNHAVFGGESKQNEFVVNGQRLFGPQGANYFEIPVVPGAFFYDEWRELKLPTAFQYQPWSPALQPMEFDRTSYYFMWPVLGDKSDSIGYFFRGRGWVRNIWGNDLEEAPYPASIKRDFLRWRYGDAVHHRGPDLARWLDGMSYGHYITRVMGLSSEVARYCDEMFGTGVGLGVDTCSAYFAYSLGLPGFRGYPPPEGAYFQGPRSNRMPEMLDVDHAHSFPGGNSVLARHLAKFLIPDAIAGGSSHEDIVNGAINFHAMDREGNETRLRLSATVTGVEHTGSSETADHVSLVYISGSRMYRLRAKTVIMAAGGWFNKLVVRDLPESHRHAYQEFNHSAVAVVNVALTNWRFLYDLGFTACRWFDGPFGFSCNLRQPMLVGSHQPPLHPDAPIVLTFYAPLVFPGLGAREQGIRGRQELLSRSYRDYETLIRQQMVDLFGASGFDPRRDIAGIVLNRWGHAFVVPEPGFYFGRQDKPAPRDVIRTRFGRIAFAHSELNGLQNFGAAVREGRRAVEQIRAVL